MLWSYRICSRVITSDIGVRYVYTYTAHHSRPSRQLVLLARKVAACIPVHNFFLEEYSLHRKLNDAMIFIDLSNDINYIQ
jgi:hypothetical protein